MQSIQLAFLTVVCLALIAVRYLFALYQQEPKGLNRLGREWTKKLDFVPDPLGGYWQLALVSMTGLFLEMLMIRWISSEIRVFAYFKNFVLIACFLGFGLGCSLCRRRINLLPMFVPLLLLALVVKLPWSGLRGLIAQLPVWLGTGSEVHYWGVPSIPLNGSSLAALASAAFLIVPLFALIALAFVPIGQMVGYYLETARNGLTGYTVNVLASLVGILLYTLLSFLSQPPWVWFALTGIMLLLVRWRPSQLRLAAAAVFLVCILVVSLRPPDNTAIYWSPYQKLTLTPIEVGGRTVAYQLQTNDNWYQQILNLSPQFVETLPKEYRTRPLKWNAYNLPYHFYPAAESVLVLGSGMGNDVAASVRHGARRVVAVEIDPLILKLGRQLHFEHPYQSPVVQTVLDDARSYIQNSNERFDLIVFSLLDSHTTSSHFSNIRIDNYVYTQEAMQAAQRLLRPDGVFIVKFQVETPWIAGRLKELLEATFGVPPFQIESDTTAYTTGGRFFITGSEQRIKVALSDPELQQQIQNHGDFAISPAKLTTDDWPYFYQHEPGLPLSVIMISVLVVLVGCWFVWGSESHGQFIRWHFFLLGGGFLLLEAQIISKMALLFGTTWIVNSVVVSGLLLEIVAANLLLAIRPRIPIGLGYAGIFISIAIAYAIPLETFFFHSLWLKALAATAVLCMPVFFAGIVFARSFAEAHFSGEALGSNLLGALVGGVLESLSFWVGLKSLLLLAALLYCASALALGGEARRTIHNPLLNGLGS